LAIPLTLALSLQERRSQIGESGGRHSEVSIVSRTKEPGICPHNHKTPHLFPHDYTAEIDMLRRAGVALTYREPGDAPPPFGLDEALTKTKQVAMHEQQRDRELFTFTPDGYLVTDLHGLI
jgi:hypothetical protein